MNLNKFLGSEDILKLKFDIKNVKYLLLDRVILKFSIN